MDKPKYCPKCGTKLIEEFSTKWVEYDKETGKKLSIVKVFCPKQTFWPTSHYFDYFAKEP